MGGLKEEFPLILGRVKESLFSDGLILNHWRDAMSEGNNFKYYKADPGDTKYDGAKGVVEDEFAHIKKWRGQLPRAGIALSGGGIRSASFSLGVLQALAKGNWLREFDYLSTVSGGGYTGSSLSYLLHLSRTDQTGELPQFGVSQDDFPYVSCPMVGAGEECESKNFGTSSKKGGLLRRLRQNAKYLTPGHGITMLSLIGVVLRNSAISILVHGGLIVLALLLLVRMDLLAENYGIKLQMNPVMWLSILSLAGYVVFSALYVVLTGLFNGLFSDDAVYRGRRFYEKTVRYLLLIGTVCFTIGVLPWLYALAKNFGEIYSVYAGTISAIFGVISSIWAFSKSSSVDKPKIPIGLVVIVSSVLLLIGTMLLAFSFAIKLEEWHSLGVGAGGILVVLILLGWFPDVNYLSIHRYYRDRLMEAFMPGENGINYPETSSGPTYTGNTTMLGNICGVGETNGVGETSGEFGKDNGPYHLICANAVLVSSSNPRYRGRGGDCFLFSPRYTGSRATGWVQTDPSQGSGMTLATAMAISGAAVNPNAGCGGDGVTRNPVLSVLMSMLNIRLGYWVDNPDREKISHCTSKLCAMLMKPNMLIPGVWESFGRWNLREDERHILLTDGGHFENLGLYELLRRRMKVIIACDGGADPNYSFGDLSNALEKARADFGTLVHITSADLDKLIPHPIHSDCSNNELELPMATQGYLIAQIEYAASNGSGVAPAKKEYGVLIYITTTFFKELDASLHGYRQSHPKFPDEPTSDQFFDEKQFESYRELGFQTAWQMMTDMSGESTGKVCLDVNGVEFPKINSRRVKSGESLVL